MGNRFLILLILICGSGLAVAQEPMKQLPVPPVAPDFRAPQKPMPELNRVGVDMNRQRPLGLRDALSMALANNKDIEVARENVRIAEFDLSGSQGAYDPRFSVST